MHSNKGKTALLVIIFTTLIIMFYASQNNPESPISSSFLSFDCTMNKTENLKFVYDKKLHVYTLQNRPILWTYWSDFSSMPPYIRLSLGLIRCHNYPTVTVMILNESMLPNFMEVHSAFRYLEENHKGDYVRGMLLWKYGGMWLDADTLQFNPVIELFEKLAQYDAYGYTWGDEELIGISIIGPIRARHPIFEYWKIEVPRILSKNIKLKTKIKALYPIGWNHLMMPVLQKKMRELLAKNETKYFSVKGEIFFAQIKHMYGDLP